MRGEIGRWRALGNALAVLAIVGHGRGGRRAGRGAALAMAGDLPRRAEFATVGGLEVGGKVRVQGIDAGRRRGDRPAADARPARDARPADRRPPPPARAFGRDGQDRRAGGRRREGRRDRPRPARRRRPWPTAARSRPSRPIEVADLLRDASPVLEEARRRGRRRQRGPGRDQRHRRRDPPGQGDARQLVQDDEAYQKLVGALQARGADAGRPGREPRRLEADLAALAILQRPRVQRPRPRPLPARLRAREPHPGRGRPVRARPLRPDGPGPRPARRGRRLVQGDPPAADGGRHRRLHRRRSAATTWPRS